MLGAARRTAPLLPKRCVRRPPRKVGASPGSRLACSLTCPAAYWTRRSSLGLLSGLGVSGAFALGGYWIQVGDLGRQAGTGGDRPPNCPCKRPKMGSRAQQAPSSAAGVVGERRALLGEGLQARARARGLHYQPPSSAPPSPASQP